MNYFDDLKKKKIDSVSAAGSSSPEGSSPKKRRIVADIVPPAKAETRSPISAKGLRQAAAIEATSRPKEEKSVQIGNARPAPRPDLNSLRGSRSLDYSQPAKPAAPEKLPNELIVEQNLPIHVWEPERARRTKRKIKIIFWSLFAAVVLAFALTTFVWPRYSITVSPRVYTAPVERIDFTAETTADQIDASSRRIPAMAVAVEKTLQKSYDSTGKKYIEEKAQGKVLIFNAYSSAPQVLIASTRFQVPSGKIFRLRDALTVPGAKVIEGKIVPTSLAANLIADSAGEEYNIGPAELRISSFRGTPKYDGFYAKNETSFSGGFKGEADIVLPEDLVRASQDLTRRIFDELKLELRNKMPSGSDFVVPNGAREIVITEIQQPNSGDRLKQFQVSVSARGHLMAIRQSHVNEVVTSVSLPTSNDFTIDSSLSQNELVLSDAKFVQDENHLSFSVAGKFKYWRMTSFDELFETLRASTPAKAESYLRSRDEIGSFQVKKFPTWLWFIPKKSGSFELSIEKAR